MWEAKIPIHEIREIRAKTTVYLGAGAIKKINEIAKELKEDREILKVVVVTGKQAYKKSGAWDSIQKALNEKGMNYLLYDSITPNPTVDQIDEEAALARQNGCKAVIGVGGGSPIDAAKCVAILLSYPERSARDIYELKFIPQKAAPLIAVNLTHGTGTEVDRFAVATIPEKEYKPSLAYDCIYPLYAIDDPRLTVTLPADQTVYVSVDALNHAVEAATTTVTSPYTILLAREAVRLVSKYLPQSITHPEDLTSRYYLLYASMIAGISFDNGLLHFTHALEHPLSAVRPSLPHGLGLGIILPPIVKRIYNAVPEILADVFSPIVPGLKGVPGEAGFAAEGIKCWLYNMGITQKLDDIGFEKKDIEKLTRLVFDTPSLKTLLDVAPVIADRQTVTQIYQESFS